MTLKLKKKMSHSKEPSVQFEKLTKLKLVTTKMCLVK